MNMKSNDLMKTFSVASKHFVETISPEPIIKPKKPFKMSKPKVQNEISVPSNSAIEKSSVSDDEDIPILLTTKIKIPYENSKPLILKKVIPKIYSTEAIPRTNITLQKLELKGEYKIPEQQQDRKIAAVIEKNFQERYGLSHEEMIELKAPLYQRPDIPKLKRLVQSKRRTKSECERQGYYNFCLTRQ